MQEHKPEIVPAHSKAINLAGRRHASKDCHKCGSRKDGPFAANWVAPSRADCGLKNHENCETFTFNFSLQFPASGTIESGIGGAINPAAREISVELNLQFSMIRGDRHHGNCVH
jgi:hypothetical protein